MLTLITRRSGVQVPPPQPFKTLETTWFQGFFFLLNGSFCNEKKPVVGEKLCQKNDGFEVRNLAQIKSRNRIKKPEFAFL